MDSPGIWRSCCCLSSQSGPTNFCHSDPIHLPLGAATDVERQLAMLPCHPATLPCFPATNLLLTPVPLFTNLGPTSFATRWWLSSVALPNLLRIWKILDYKPCFANLLSSLPSNWRLWRWCIFFVKSSRFKTDEGGPFNSSDSSDIVDRWLKTILVQVKNMKYAIIAIPIPNWRLPQPVMPNV